MFNSDDPSFPPLTNVTTEQIQQYLEENKQLIMAIMEGQNQGKFTEIAPCQAKLQYNLTYLAKLADVTQPPEQSHSPLPSQFAVLEGQAAQHPHVTMSQQQPDLSPLSLPFQLNNQQQLQHHPSVPLPQPDLFNSKLPFQMNEEQQQQQQHKQPAFFQQQQLIQGPMSGLPAPNANGGIYQASQSRLGGVNLFGSQESNQLGSDAGAGCWALGNSPFGRSNGNARP